MKYNGIDPRTLHPGISIAKEIPPGTIASQLETLAGSTGEIIAGRTIKQAEYIVRVNIAGKSIGEAWKIRALLAGWARADDEKPRELIPTHWPEVHYDAILKEISPPEFVFGFGVIDVVFTIPRPVAVENQTRSYNTAVEAAAEDSNGQQLLTMTGEEFLTSEGENFVVTGADSGTLTIGGTTWTRPLIGVSMYDAEGMTLMIDGKTVLSLSGSYKRNDFVFVYTDPPKVQVMDGGMPYDVNDRLDYTVTDFEAICKALTPGTHTISATGAATISVVWRDTWL